jgi:polysaccharide pyruvyl transferase WcaK-like protein
MIKDKYQKLPILHFSETIKKRHIKKQLRCIIFGNFGAMNLGDEAILAGEIQELQKIPNIIITVVGRYPKEIQRLHKVNALSLYTLNKVRKEIKKSDFIIIGGGGLINKIERNIIGFFYQLYMLFAFFYLPRFYRKKAYILGIGIYNNANALILNLALPFFKSANLVTVRDHHSQDFLKKKNVHGGLYKDNSFLMDLSPISQVQQEPFFKNNLRKNKMNIGISLVKPENKQVEKKLIKELVQFVKNHKEKADFWLYATDYNPEYFNDVKFSMVFVNEIKKQLKEEVVIHIVPTDMKPQIYFASFKIMHFFVAMRFHAAVFAYRNKIPFAGISYDKKCASFIESIGLHPMKIKDVTAANIEKHIL